MQKVGQTLLQMLLSWNVSNLTWLDSNLRGKSAPDNSFGYIVKVMLTRFSLLLRVRQPCWHSSGFSIMPPLNMLLPLPEMLFSPAFYLVNLYYPSGLSLDIIFLERSLLTPWIESVSPFLVHITMFFPSWKPSSSPSGSWAREQRVLDFMEIELSGKERMKQHIPLLKTYRP